MPKAKPVSLHPLSFEEAISTLINTDRLNVDRALKTKKPKNTKSKISKAVR